MEKLVTVYEPISGRYFTTTNAELTEISIALQAYMNEKHYSYIPYNVLSEMLGLEPYCFANGFEVFVDCDNFIEERILDTGTIIYILNCSIS